MKSLYESLLTGKVPKPSAKVQPSSKEELQQLVSEHIEKIKPRPGQEVDLNWIDISEVDDLNELFADTNYIPVIDTWKIDHVMSFESMFRNNVHIKSSPLPRLQKKLLSYGCYKFMFEGCTSLTRAPELPATKLTNNCYVEMFADCTALKVAPQLLATQLAPNCYDHMFFGCTSLEVAPELPATKLPHECYFGMFISCTSLEKKAKIPGKIQSARSSTYDMYEHCPCEDD